MVATRSNPILTCSVCGHPVLIGSATFDQTARPVHEHCTDKVNQENDAKPSPPDPGTSKSELFRKRCLEDAGQDIAEYAVMLAVILVLVVGTVRLIGSNANNVFSSAASTLQ
jgi:Flp pilus assembly pilin Flp